MVDTSGCRRLPCGAFLTSARSRIAGYLAVMGTVAILCAPMAPADTPPTSDDLATAVKAGWERLKQSSEMASGSYQRVTQIDNFDPTDPRNGTHEVSTTEVAFWVSGDSRKVEVQYTGHAGRPLQRRVFCSTPDHAFTAQTNRSAAEPYALQMFGRDQAAADKARRAMGPAPYNTSIPYAVSEDLEQHGDARPRFYEVERDGKTLVAVEYSFLQSDGTVPEKPFQTDCKWLVDPAADYRVVSGNIGLAAGWCTYQYEVTYRDAGSSSDLAMVVDHTEFRRDQEVIQTVVDVWQFSPTSHEPIPVSEFTLTSVGLPEIPKTSHLRFWLLIILGPTLVGMGVTLYLLSHRKARSSPHGTRGRSSALAGRR